MDIFTVNEGKHHEKNALYRIVVSFHRPFCLSITPGLQMKTVHKKTFTYRETFTDVESDPLERHQLDIRRFNWMAIRSPWRW